jgi:aspartate ammonia-lyase
VVNQVAFEVVGFDMTVTMAAEAGQLQLNAFEPVICYSLSAGLWRLRQAMIVLAEKCVDGITANQERLRESVENSIGLVTALNPYIGYQAATDIAREALFTGAGVAELVVAHGLMDAEQLAAILRPEVLAHLQHAETTPSAPEATGDDPETE